MTKKAAAVPERSKIADKHKWKPEHLFKSDEEWEDTLKSVSRRFRQISKFKGKLLMDKNVLACLQTVSSISKVFYKLALYAGLKRDEDTRESKYQGYRQMLSQAGTEFYEAASFISPELTALPTEDLRRMIASSAFKDYDFELKDLLRQKKHVLSDKEEALMATLSLGSGAAASAYSIFSNADLKFPKIKDEEGREIELTDSNFGTFQKSKSRRVRKAAFQTMYKTIHGYRNTTASLLSSFIKEQVAHAKARKHKSALHAALGGDNIPVAVYHTMVEAINSHLPSLHRYLELRRRMMKLKELRYHDLYPSLIKGADMEFSHEEACRLVIEATEPMGREYTEALKHGLDPVNGWVDVLPNRGKRSGAYMNGVHGVHPYVLTNFLGAYGSVSTLAHEMGHAMHSYFSNRTQVYDKADYSIFVAEVASTLNEALLMEHMLKSTPNPPMMADARKQRLFLLGQKLEDFRTTVFRQAMFAEFELVLYEAVERKEPLTADSITEMYLGIVRKYYGHAEGIVLVDDLYGMEWARIPHFYYNFYVFQYTTGMTAATTLARRILDEGPKARDRYIKNLLKAGGSDYPVKLLKRAGADLTKRKAYDIAMWDFEDALKEVETLVK